MLLVGARGERGGGGGGGEEEEGEEEGKEQYLFKISNRFAGLENLNYVDINRDWETITVNTKISGKASLGYYELKKYKAWFDKGCSMLY
jgi:hypothetical protein